MKMTVRCRCGKLQGELDAQGVAARARCYCKDCQAYARWLQQQPDFLDEAGGTDIAASLPAALRFTQGLEHLGCMSLSDKGIYRWYATCCRTPIGNTPRTSKVAYVGLVRAALAESDEVLQRQLGSARTALNTESATRPVKSTPLSTAWDVAKIARMIIGARLTGRNRTNPFFEPGSSRPVKPPQVLTPAQRAALG